jgi:hypothetical protein
VGLNYLDQENYDDAREAFQKALDEDPKFDLAEQALIATPVAAMLVMGTSETIAGLSSSGFTSAAAGSAVVGGLGVVGVTTAVVAGVAAVAGGVAAAGGGGGSSGGSSSSTTELNLTGDWIGTWIDSSGNSGDISLTLTQSDTSVTGNVFITGSECISTGTISGTITDDTLESEIVSGSDVASFIANCTSTSMSGTLEFTSGECVGDSGSFSISITGSATIDWPTVN